MACAKDPPPSVVRVVYQAPPDRPTSVRTSERIKAYPVGRYVDPTHRQVMHEGHTIYRIEKPAGWNLQSTESPPSRPSRGEAARQDELLMEINRQRQATQAILASGKTVSEKLSALSEALEKAKTAAVKNQQLQQEIEEIKRQIDALKQQTSQPPAPQIETTW